MTEPKRRKDDSALPIDLDLVRRYLESREEETKRLDRLEKATQRLSADTTSLSKALETYATQAQVEDIESVLDRHDQKFEVRARELIAIRLRIRRRTNIMFAITVGLILLGTSTVGYFVHRETSQRKAICEDRNVQTMRTSERSREFFKPKVAEAEKTGADPVLIDILKVLAQQQPNLVDCDGGDDDGKD
jgi:hypothetical protein